MSQRSTHPTGSTSTPLHHHTHHFVGLDLFRPLLYVGLQEADKRGDVARPLPQDGLEEVGEEGHVGRGNTVRVHLQQQGEDLEDVRDELCKQQEAAVHTVCDDNRRYRTVAVRTSESG